MNFISYKLLVAKGLFAVPKCTLRNRAKGQDRTSDSHRLNTQQSSPRGHPTPGKRRKTELQGRDRGTGVWSSFSLQFTHWSPVLSAPSDLDPSQRKGGSLQRPMSVKRIGPQGCLCVSFCRVVVSHPTPNLTNSPWERDSGQVIMEHCEERYVEKWVKNPAESLLTLQRTALIPLFIPALPADFQHLRLLLWVPALTWLFPVESSKTCLLKH